MIEEIKKALDKYSHAGIAEGSYLAEVEIKPNSPKWLRYLIGEVERLNGERDYFERVSNQHYDKWRELAEHQEEDRPRFRMDAQGNLTRFEEE